MSGRVIALLCLAACGGGGAGGVDGGDGDGDGDGDAAAAADAAGGGGDAGGDDSLAWHRDRLFRGNPELGTGADACARWTSLETSRRAVFLTLTHRLYISRMADDSHVLAHITGCELILGGGSDGTQCGGAENNRLFLTLDDPLWQAMVDTWNGEHLIGDGADSTWIHTEDLAGPHDPFTASDETDTGLSCLALIELSDSKPPTAQGHFFLDGDAVAVQRGAGIDLPADPRLFEIDHDFDCLHQSNPVCPGKDFDDEYAASYGDFECDWVPLGCTPSGTGCYRGTD
ncbi:MAG TPA: hypothetical protein VL172_19555 [Kofleriaceae bacterium]|nr:hypothetical protein [Kofleriaceae bacterium]